MGMHRIRLAALVAVLALATSGCYYAQAFQAAQNGDPAPWFCHPVAENSVTGPGMGTTNWYAGITRGALDPETCKTVGLQFDLAKAYAEQYPTLADAEAAGFISSFGFIPGMGTHHGLGAISPALLADPTFDRFDPVIPNSIMDGTFDPAKPEFLQYNGNGPDAVLVGMSYYVRTEDGQPPEGFPGDNDWWHHHPTLCMDPATAQAFTVNTTDAQCTSRGGINVYMDDWYMLHVWLVDDLELHDDVHAPMHPCIDAGGAIFDMADPCHDELPPAAGASATGTSFRSAGDAAAAPVAFCPLGLLAAEPEKAAA